MTNPFEPPAGDAADPGAPAPAPYGQSMPPYGQSMPPYGQPQPGQYPYPPPGYGGYPAAPRNGLGTAGLVLGIIGAVIGAFMFLFPVAFILGVLAVVFGLIGRSRAKQGQASNKTAATWGFALGVVSLVLSVIGLVVVIHIAQDRQECRDRAVTPQQYNDCNHTF